MKQKIWIARDFEPARSFVEQLPVIFSKQGISLHDGRNKVRLFEVRQQRVVVKRYKQPLWHQRIIYATVRATKAERAYHYARRLLDMGIDTPRPLACLNCYKGGLLTYCYFVSPEDTRRSCWDLYDSELPRRMELLNALAAYLLQLHDKGFLHGDTNLSNFLYAANPSGGFDFAVIDVNRSKFVSSPTQEQCLMNMVRLSHDRILLTAVVTEYARLRQWDADACVDRVMQALDAFERRDEMKRKVFRKRNK